MLANVLRSEQAIACLLYTSDAADERSSVDLGGRRIIKKKKNEDAVRARETTQEQLICVERTNI